MKEKIGNIQMPSLIDDDGSYSNVRLLFALLVSLTPTHQVASRSTHLGQILGRLCTKLLPALVGVQCFRVK